MLPVVNNAHCESAESLCHLGWHIAKHIECGDVVAINGLIGVGKTTLVQGIAAGLGIEEQITSPTFTIIHNYDGAIPMYHIDLYRIEHENELAPIGIFDLFQGSEIILIEWADKYSHILPTDAIAITITAPAPTTRTVIIQRA